MTQTTVPTEIKAKLIPAALKDYPTIQNMARFYVYDLSRECGFISKDWNLPADGLYESFDFKYYFESESHVSYLIKVQEELAGFVLLERSTAAPRAKWIMGEFFILAKFQGKGIGITIAHEIWDKHRGSWEVSVIPENKSAVHFWEKAIRLYTNGQFHQEVREVDYDKDQPKRIVFSFEAASDKVISNAPSIIVRHTSISDIQSIVALSKAKRLTYEKAQPQFWRYAGVEAEVAQTAWFKELLDDKKYLMFTAQSDAQEILGFIIGKLIPAPEVYNPGGLTLMIDDFCVQSEAFWPSVGAQLIEGIQKEGRAKGATQILVVCGAHDNLKRIFLSKQGLSIASEWFVGRLI